MDGCDVSMLTSCDNLKFLKTRHSLHNQNRSFNVRSLSAIETDSLSVWVQ